MPDRLTVLASGSSGNASLLELGSFGLLIDCGLAPAELGNRLSQIGKTWSDISAVILTHTHADHWNRYTLEHLRRISVPLIAHRFHHSTLAARAEHEPLRRANLTREYEEDARFLLTPNVACVPIRVPHDSFPTFAFRLETTQPEGEPGWSLGFASDLGRVSDDLLTRFAGVNVLAIEYNHDEAMQRASRRPRLLINRVLGDHGHLSNRQAADATQRIAASSSGFRAVVLLHLSRECNQPVLAETAAHAALSAVAPRAAVITASQFEVATPVELIPQPVIAPRPIVLPSYQPSLPGFDEPISDEAR